MVIIRPRSMKPVVNLWELLKPNQHGVRLVGIETKVVLIGALGIVSGLGALQAIGGDLEKDFAAQAATEPLVEQSAPAQRSSPAPINSGATSAYTVDMYPTLVRKFGAMIPTIERERSAAAQITAQDTNCDEVITVQITSRSVSNNRRYYADCKNRTRIFFDAESIAAGHPAGLQTWDDILADGVLSW